MPFNSKSASAGQPQNPVHKGLGPCEILKVSPSAHELKLLRRMRIHAILNIAQLSKSKENNRFPSKPIRSPGLEEYGQPNVLEAERIVSKVSTGGSLGAWGRSEATRMTTKPGRHDRMFSMELRRG